MLTGFGIAVLSFMLAMYALERRGPRYVLGFALGCALSSSYGFLSGAWPFGIIEAIWAIIAVRRFALSISTRKTLPGDIPRPQPPGQPRTALESCPMSDTSFASAFIAESIEILSKLAVDEVNAVIALLADTRERGGRLFFCGSGGGAGHASHATCDFRKLGGFEAYCVSDNVSELTARVNDDGWERAYADWLIASRINAKDCLVVFSVGGGDEARNISPNLVNAMLQARQVGASVTGVVGRDGGSLRRLADACILVPVVVAANVTAQAEAMQALLWHLMIMHPDISRATPKWESMEPDPAPEPLLDHVLDH